MQAEKIDVAGGRHPSITPTHRPNRCHTSSRRRRKAGGQVAWGKSDPHGESSHQLSACFQPLTSIIHTSRTCYPDGGLYAPFTSLLLFPDCMVI